MGREAKLADKKKKKKRLKLRIVFHGPGSELELMVSQQEVRSQSRAPD